MKHRKAVKITTYIAGVFILVATLTVAALMLMSALGMFFPRKIKVIINTPDKSKVYDESSLSADEPVITYGNLRLGDKLVTVSRPSYNKVGEYTNAPEYMIIDRTGAEVTADYEVIEDFGMLTIEPRSVRLVSQAKLKMYDGETLYADQITISPGSIPLLSGHTLISTVNVSLTEPGEIQIPSNYSIVNKFGEDVTDQYHVIEEIGAIKITARPVLITTLSAQKLYDGEPLSNPEWYVLRDSMLLPGHTVNGECVTSVSAVGVYDNKADITVTDENGNNVNHLYDIRFDYGKLTVEPIQLEISTASMTKEYDGSPLTLPEWVLATGRLIDGHEIFPVSAPVLDKPGTITNKMTFVIRDSQGADVTSTYKINHYNGSLTITARQLHIRTGTASKIYDGKALVCEEYEIVTGSLCEGETIDIAFASLDTLGISDNYVVSCTIYAKNEDGSLRDVTRYYHITYDYGTLTVTSPQKEVNVE